MNSPLVSIIVPVYNVEPYIRQCMESLCAQTLRDIEIICVDDCGHDGSMSIVEEFAAADDRIQILKLAENRGQGAARNAGMAIAKGAYIMFCDGDDCYTPEMSKECYTAMAHSPTPDLAVCGYCYIWEYEEDAAQIAKLERSLRIKHTGFQSVTRAVREQCPVTPWCKIYRADFLKRYHIRFPEGVMFEDIAFHHICLAHAQNIYFIPKQLYSYRKRRDSTCGAIGRPYWTDHLPVGIMLWERCLQDSLLNDDAYLQHICIGLMEAGLSFFSKQGRAAIGHKMMAAFLKKSGYTRTLPPKALAYMLFRHYGNKSLVHKRKICCGLVKIKESVWEKKTYCLGLRVHHIKYDLLRSTRRLFGIRLGEYRECARFNTPAAGEHHQLLESLRSVGNFAYVPCIPSADNILSHAAAIQYFDAHHLPYSLVYPGDAESPATIVLGGVIWHQGNEKIWQEYIPMLQNAQRVIILPSSFAAVPGICEMFDSRYTVFCQDEATVKACKGHAQEAILCNGSMACMVNPQMITSPIPRIWNAGWICYEMLGASQRILNKSAAILTKLPADQYDDIAAARAGVEVGTLLSFHVGVRYSKEEILFAASMLLYIISRFHDIITDHPDIRIAAALMGCSVHPIERMADYTDSPTLKQPLGRFLEHIWQLWQRQGLQSAQTLCRAQAPCEKYNIQWLS